MNIKKPFENLNFSSDDITYLLMVSCIALFMSVKGWANISFALILIIAISQLNTYIHSFNNLLNTHKLKILFVVLSLPVFALLITQTVRGDWIIKSYDGPIRVLFAILLVFYFSSRKINVTNIIGLASPICLILTATAIYFHPEYLTRWGGRYATNFVDPNSFGAYTVIFTSFCLFSLTNPIKSSLWLPYQLIGIIVGIGLIIGSGTRGSWLSIPFVLLFWLITNRQRINKKLIVLGLSLMCVFPILGLTIFPNSSVRLYGIYSEVYAWSHHASVETSAGIRLTMWKMAWALFEHNPWYGYGDIGIKSYLSEPWLTAIASPEGLKTMNCCGPHNELLANLLRSGVMGGLSVLGLLIYPIYQVAKYLKHPNTKITLASQLLITYLIIVIISGFSMETFNLKYSCSFYSLIISGLIGQIIFTKHKESARCQN